MKIYDVDFCWLSDPSGYLQLAVSGRLCERLNSEQLGVFRVTEPFSEIPAGKSVFALVTVGKVVELCVCEKARRNRLIMCSMEWNARPRLDKFRRADKSALTNTDML